MADSFKISTRSNHGCWTCRLRRKKCDERRPVCSVCVCLELQCHGYGPRPSWMDKGALQREQASRVKILVSQTKSRKGKQQKLQSGLYLASQASGDAMELLPTQNAFVPTAPVLDAVDRHLGAYNHDEHRQHISEVSFNDAVDSVWSTWHSNNIPTAELSLNLGGSDARPITTQTGYSRRSSVPSESSGHIPVSASDLQMIGECSIVGGAIVFSKESHFPENQSLHTDTNQRLDSAAHHHSCPQGTSVFASPSKVSTLFGYTEDALFMCYLDQVFYVQYPFYHSTNVPGRGWLFSILQKVKPAYHGALALSERYLLATSPQNVELTTSLVQLRTQNGHYDMAVQGMHVLVNDFEASSRLDRLILSLDILTSLLQLLFFELFNGGGEDWQVHLLTASKFVPFLLQTMPGSICPEYASDPFFEMILNPEVDNAINALLGSFITFDIIASASTRSPVFLNIDHVKVLQTFEVTSENLTGCNASVMVLILEISRLDEWKKEIQRANKLSVVDLVTRGGQIQKRLRQELAFIEDLSRSSNSTRAPARPEISKIFALSAVTYLHVVMSGPYPELPEIAESVAETIKAFKCLKDPKLIQHVAWPLCISGCLALEKHYDFFRGLVSAAGISKWAIGTCFEALRVMEECWNARTASTECCDWVTIMKQHSRYVLLR